MKKEIEFKPFKEIRNELGWEFRQHPPIGQQWGYDNGFCTNGRGEGFRLHQGTKWEEIYKLVDTLNKRDVEIANLKTKHLVVAKPQK